MVLRQNATRRRRIVIDPKNQGDDAGIVHEEAPTSARKKKRSLYKAGAERRFQWKTTDLLPKRRWGMAITIALLVVSIVGINLLYFYCDRWLNYIGTEGLSALQLSGTATLAAWFSSFLLIISGFASLQIYALRQHRQDDYRGSYRLWLWMAGILMLASFNCVVDLTAIGTQLISSVTRLSFQSSFLSMVTLKIVLLTALVARGSYEVRESRSSLMLVVLVWLAYGAAATLQLPQLQPVMANLPQSTFQIAHGNLILFGTVFVFMAQIVFARFVYLQALGMIKQKASKAKNVKSKSTSGAKSKSQTGTSKTRKKASVKSDRESSEDSTEENVKDRSEKSDTDRTKISAEGRAKDGSKERTKESDKERKKDSDKDRSGVNSSKQITSRRPDETTQGARPTSGQTKSDLAKQHRHETDDEDDSDQDSSILKLSKSEQRRQRKQQQSSSHRRAA